MGFHTLRYQQVVSAPLERCWEFFSNPQNLAEITPPSLEFRVVSDPPATITEGLLIRYRVRPIFGIPLTWVSEITRVEPPYCFVDEQKTGPYARWRHEHTFRSVDAARTEIQDVVSYEPPFGWLGEMFHPRLIAPRLAEIFSFRETAVHRLFATTPGA